MIFVWLIVLILTGWVGLATVLAGVSLIPAFLFLDGPGGRLWYAIVLAAFMIFTHRSNIRSMLNGTEYRFEKAMIRKWFD
jgi:glycerol-3-phosphate acyltransferase PlsY